MPRALIVFGGWEGHRPREAADEIASLLRESKFEVKISDSLEVFSDREKLLRLNLLVPHWTMGEISADQLAGVCEAVRSGVGLAGCHGGMCDAFRNESEWSFMTGGQWVAHPGDLGANYTVKIKSADHDITRGLKDFHITSEQYYLHVDPAVQILATTSFPTADGPHVGNGPVEMPVVWTKLYGKGRVFYDSIGHAPHEISTEPNRTIMSRGMQWASGA